MDTKMQCIYIFVLSSLDILHKNSAFACRNHWKQLAQQYSTFKNFTVHWQSVLLTSQGINHNHYWSFVKEDKNQMSSVLSMWFNSAQCWSVDWYTNCLWIDSALYLEPKHANFPFEKVPWDKMINPMGKNVQPHLISIMTNNSKISWIRYCQILLPRHSFSFFTPQKY